LSTIDLLSNKPEARRCDCSVLAGMNGSANLIVWLPLLRSFEKRCSAQSCLHALGSCTREGQVIHVIANQLYDWSSEISKLHRGAQDFALHFGRGDEIARRSRGTASKRPKPSTNEMRLKSRDFR
jgi:error-prone DNA polymerase